jgi:pimeloyl-ACP methyl ester carboxylesterase
MTTLESGERLGLPSPFLRFGLGVGIGALVTGAYQAAAQAEYRAGLERWPVTPTEVHGLPSDAREAVVTFPGLGSVDGETYAGHVQDLFACPSAYVHYSSEGVDYEEVASQLIASAPNLKRLHVNGHSMGGRHGLEVARIAHDMTKGQIELGKVVLYCSPYDWRDVRNKVTGCIVLAAHRIGWQGGPRSKTIVSTVKRGLDAEGMAAKFRRDNWVGARNAARKDAEGGISPRNYPQTLHGFKRSRPPHLQMSSYAPLMGPETSAIMLRPERPADDRTVITDASSAKWNQFFTKNGVQYHDVLVPGMNHANVAMGCAALAGYIEKERYT